MQVDSVLGGVKQQLDDENLSEDEEGNHNLALNGRLEPKFSFKILLSAVALVERNETARWFHLPMNNFSQELSNYIFKPLLVPSVGSFSTDDIRLLTNDLTLLSNLWILLSLFSTVSSCSTFKLCCGSRMTYNS